MKSARLFYPLAVLSFCFIHCPGYLQSQDSKDKDKGWTDLAPKQFKELERLKERPGNFSALVAIGEFYEAIYRIRPDYSRCTFPFQNGRKVHERLADIEKELDAKKIKVNDLREYIIVIRSLSLHDSSTFEETEDYNNLDQGLRKRFAEVKKRFTERGLVALVINDLHSLLSPKIEKGTGKKPEVLYLIKSKDGWKVAWYEES